MEGLLLDGGGGFVMDGSGAIVPEAMEDSCRTAVESKERKDEENIPSKGDEKG